jgi:V8-like Glu-specific endopeptidase
MSYNPDNQLSEVGHPGKWKGIVTCAQNSETNFTGSNYGAGACFIANDAAIIAGTVITFTDGSTATAAVLFADAGGEVKGAFKAIEASISKVVVHNTSNAEIYVLKRNYQIR